MGQLLISYIVVTHDSAETIVDCVDALKTQAPFGMPSEVLVVDTESLDRTVELASGAGATVLPVTNEGFGASCNAGARAACGDHLLFVNPDTIFPTDTVPELVRILRAIEATGRSGVVCPRFSHVAPSHDDGFRLWHFPTSRQIARFLRRPAAYASEVDARALTPQRLNGAAFLIRRTTFEDIGGFDERFFLYFEDSDLSERLTDAGTELAVADATSVFHARGHSTGRRVDLGEIQARSNVLLAANRFGRRGGLVCVADLALTTLLFAFAETVTGRGRIARRRLRRIRALGAIWTELSELDVERRRQNRIGR